MDLYEALKGLGLTISEVKVYLYLLEHGIAAPPEIARATDITRSNLHYVLLGLAQHNLVKKQQHGKRYVYIPADPKETLHLLDVKRRTLEDSLEGLAALYKQQKNKPVIKFFDGASEVEHIFDHILLAELKEVLGFTSLARLFEALPLYKWANWQKELKRRGIFLQDILSASSHELAEQTHATARPYQDYKLLPERYGDTPTDILVWDNKVAIMVLDAPVFGTVIESKSLAETYRIQFDLMWKALPRPSVPPERSEGGQSHL